MKAFACFQNNPLKIDSKEREQHPTSPNLEGEGKLKIFQISHPSQRVRREKKKGGGGLSC
jgi:hypothetical protein